MNITLFLTLFTIGSMVSSLLTEALKKAFSEMFKYRPELPSLGLACDVLPSETVNDNSVR